ncbi:hypothetical protein [Iningainema tapete]|uniref:Calcium-binding protein n=1 Tax=Iningainema tapete BLCC-T55 TaxID=2748662 RepID=A0A8J6XPI6_9CYAN|nr:hypothetical protein [Iningainema tapete]MBD2775729.1 hypothetical protein [Iningainema tapete BLCC-T55]
MTSGPAVNIYINVKGREPNGVVEPSEYKELQQRILQTLNSLQDTNPNYALQGAVPLFNNVYERSVSDNPSVEEIITASSDFIGQDTGDVFALLSVGYNFDGFQPSVLRKDDAVPTQGQPILSVPTFYGAHGYDPTLPEMQAIFLAAGPDFNSNVLPGLNEVRSIDIAPTILDLLDVEPAPTIQGQSIFAQNTAVGTLAPVFGTAQKDTLEVSGNNALVFAGAGDDLIDALNSRGGNRVYTGSGNDTLILGSGDRLFGDDGNDRFFVQTGGNNVITGGVGTDQFWIAVAEIPKAVNTITDFVSGEDVIGIAGLGINFGQLSISQEGENTRIAANGKDLAVLSGIQASSLSAPNFVFV